MKFLKFYGFLFALLWGIISLQATHDFYLATFNWYEKDQKHTVKITLDKEDTFKAILEDKPKHKDNFSDQNIQPSLKSYLQQNFKIRANQHSINYTFRKIQFTENFVYLLLDLQNVPKKIKTIQIINTCLFKVCPKQQNIHKVYLQNSRQIQKTELENQQFTLSFD